jgi:CBS domain-containing protein
MAELTKLTAEAVMQRHVVTIGPNDSLQEAMALMTEHHVSGLPVLNAKDRCVGVVSASDILNFEQERAGSAGDAEEIVSPYFDPETGRWERIRVFGGLDELPEVPVGEIMTRDLVSVAPRTPIVDVARKMLEEDIHRILVLDDEYRLHGIISSIDFVRLFAEQT